METTQNEPKCTVITGKNGSVNIEILPEKEALEITANTCNIQIDRVRMKAIVQLGKGKAREFNGPMLRVDGKPLELLKKLMMRPGRFLSSYDIGNIGDRDESFFIGANITSYLAKLRKFLFVGNGYKFIKTSSRPYRIALNGDISFCWIEPYNENKDQE